MSNQIELRPMQYGEEDAVFRLLEQCFGEPASFFREREHAVPFPCQECHWVAVRGGEVISHAVYYPVEIRGAESVLKTGILANVCTAASHRGQGIAARLVERINTAMSEAALDYSCLAGHAHYYSRFGYIDDAPETRTFFAGDAGAAANTAIRPWRSEDISWQAELYQANTAQRAGSMLRTHAYWELTLGLSYVETLVRAQGDGYAVLSHYRPPGWALEELQLMELEAASEEAAIDLFRAALGQAGFHGAQLLWSVGPHPYREPLLRYFGDLLQDSHPAPGFMWKKLRHEAPVVAPLYLSHLDIR